MDWNEKEERALYMYKNRISVLPQKEEGGKKQPKKRPDLGEGEERVYVLTTMSVTFPTCQVERSPLKAVAL